MLDSMFRRQPDGQERGLFPIGAKDAETCGHGHSDPRGLLDDRGGSSAWDALYVCARAELLGNGMAAKRVQPNVIRTLTALRSWIVGSVCSWAMPSLI